MRYWSITRSTPISSSCSSRSWIWATVPTSEFGPLRLEVGLGVGRVIATDLGHRVGALEQVDLVRADDAARHQRDHRLRAIRLPPCPPDGGDRLGALLRGHHHQVVLIGPASGQSQAAGLRAAADDQVRRGERLGQCVAAEPVVLTLEVERTLIPLAPDDLDLLLEQLESLSHRREREAVGGMLGLEPARPHAELDPTAARDVVGGDDVLRQHRRMPEGGRRDERSQAEVRGDRRQPGDRRPRVEGTAIGPAHHRQVVVGAEERVDRALLARLRECQPLLPGHRLLPLDHQADTHQSTTCASVITWILPPYRKCTSTASFLP